MNWQEVTVNIESQSGAVQLAESLAVPRQGALRYFFVGYGVLFLFLSVIGFAPSFHQYFTGEYYFPPFVHVHGALMVGFLALYLTQAVLASRGNLRRHRKLGLAATVLGPAVWISMGVATIVAFRRNDPAGEFAFLTSVLLIQLGVMVLFPVFVTGGLLARRNPDWHRRLMTLASLVLLQAAVDRMHWLPDEGLPMFWHHGIRLYVLLIPLFIFDWLTLRRIHAATLIGTGLIVAMHAVVSYYWENEAWNQLALGFWLWVR